MSIPRPQQENLYPTLPITAPSHPMSHLNEIYHSLPPRGRLRALADLAELEKYRDERLNQLTSDSRTNPTTSQPAKTNHSFSAEARRRVLADVEKYREDRLKQPTSDSRTTPTTSRSDKTYHSLSGQARIGVLAVLEKDRYERHKQLKTTPTTSLTTPYSNANTVPVPPPRGTKRYCTWRCRSWREKHRSEEVRECKCGFEHDLVHPSEWRGTPAEADWDYSVGVRNGGWVNKQRTVRFEDPVVTDALEAEEEGESEEESEEESEVESEEEEEDGEEKWVMIGRSSWKRNGFVSEYPDEEMEDAFEELDTSIYRGTGS